MVDKEEGDVPRATWTMVGALKLDIACLHREVEDEALISHRKVV